MEVKMEQLLDDEDLFIINEVKSVEKYLYSNNPSVIFVGIIDKLIKKYSELYGENLLLKKRLEILHNHILNLGDELYQHGVECFSILDDVDQLQNGNPNYKNEITEPIDSRGFPGDN